MGWGEGWGQGEGWGWGEGEGWGGGAWKSGQFAMSGRCISMISCEASCAGSSLKKPCPSRLIEVRGRVRGDTSKPGSGANMSSHLIRDRVRVRDRV